MRFLLTMNMPSAHGNPIHQLTVESDAVTMEHFWEEMNDNEFILARLLYREKNMQTGEVIWTNKGEIILNTAHIGKVQEFIDHEKDNTDESFRNFEQRSWNTEGKRPPLRPRGRLL